MGNNAPRHYLKCDGMAYNISEYPKLSQHFINEFNKVNYFGGDGTNTFAVPDLRGEFLRGTGTNSRENCGSGSNVGLHQNATSHAYFYNNSNNGDFVSVRGAVGSNFDSTINGTARNWANNTLSDTINMVKTYTSRPTNTSVLYCIRYE